MKDKGDSAFVPPMSLNKLELIIPFAIKVKILTTFFQATNSIQYLAIPTLFEEILNKLTINRRVE